MKGGFLPGDFFLEFFFRWCVSWGFFPGGAFPGGVYI